MPGSEECAVLYLSYCLSEDQSWLLATATDDRGEIFETATINIDIPNRKRRKRASARRIGLQKLMDFILGIMSQGVSKRRKKNIKLPLKKKRKKIKLRRYAQFIFQTSLSPSLFPLP